MVWMATRARLRIQVARDHNNARMMEGLNTTNMPPFRLRMMKTLENLGRLGRQQTDG
jgi:hypothetical protein